ncbi:MAG: hypothetical protein KZQ90_10060 [Candidatus Thiodiazotropha sp. (ex Codakia rugifera)]|nr:hypothetical protein [Candidatus Thiodiazotropha sp. (ex Codakia rugifera)]
MEKTAGRPPNKSPIKPLRVKSWFYYVAARLDLKRTGYALESYLEQEKVKRNHEGTVNRPCKYDRYKKGLHIPELTLVDRVEDIVPGSKSLLNHPFWEVANPIEDIAELYVHLNKLSPEVVNLLFHPGTEPGKIPIRHRQDYITTLETLSEIADLDAFAALIGLHQEDILTNTFKSPMLHILYMKPLLTAFRKLISQPLFPDIADELFEYITTTLFSELKSETADKLITKMNISQAIDYSRFLLSIVDKLEILQKYTYPPVSCMHIINRYMTKNILAIAFANDSDKDWLAFKRLPEIKNLTKTLKRWELKQTNFSPIPWS